MELAEFLLLNHLLLLGEESLTQGGKDPEKGKNVSAARQVFLAREKQTVMS